MRSVCPTRRFTVPSAEAHRLVTQASLWKTRLKTVFLLRFTGSSTTRLHLSLVASAAQPGPSLTLGATSRYLYKLCISRFDGRHSLGHAGTYFKCTRVLDFENSALYWFISFTISQIRFEWPFVLP